VSSKQSLSVRLQVDDDEDECYDDDYPYETDDSNAEDNPLFDYPEELSEDEDDGSSDEDPFGHGRFWL